MSVFDNSPESYCCEGMKAMIVESITTDSFTPIGYYKGFYSLSFRIFYFCPFCGSLIVEKTHPSSSPEDRSFCCGAIEHFCNIEDVYEDFVEFGIFYDSFSRRYYFSTNKEWLNEKNVDLKTKIYKLKNIEIKTTSGWPI